MRTKRVLTMLLTAAMVLVGLISPESVGIDGFALLVQAEGASYEAGDINLDGDIDYLDAMTALRYDAELVDLSETQMSLGDVNSDGAVDSLDAILILRYDAGLVEEFSNSAESSSIDTSSSTSSDTSTSTGTSSSSGTSSDSSTSSSTDSSSGTSSDSDSSTEVSLTFCSAEEAVYVLNTNTKKIHYPGCRWVSTIHDENLAYYNGDIEDLFAADYTWCKTCNK